MNQRIQLSDHFTTSRILRFAASPIIMMVFTSIYSVVDGFFVSNFAGKQAFAAVNLIMPFLQAFGCIGFMLGTGGSALVARRRVAEAYPAVRDLYGGCPAGAAPRGCSAGGHCGTAG